MTKPGRPLFGYRARFTLTCYALLAVQMTLLVVFVYVPVFWAFSKSFFQFEVGSESHFVGFANYTELLFRDPTTLPSLLHMLFLTAFAVCVRLTIPLVVAKLIHSLSREKSRYLFRILFLVPVVVPGVAVQLIWFGMIYNDRGMANELLRAVGLEHWVRGWLSDPSTALVAVAFVGFPWVGGFEVLIYYAGLSSIPESVTEAALLEGCTGIQKFFRIDIPMVMSQLKLILILTIIGGVQSFESLFILTKGGPGFKTMVPGLWMYFNAFSFQRMGYACAIGVCLFFIIFGLTVLNMRYFRSTTELEGQG
ncbi:MAG TPA: sugar ABC transporter permease [Candidatus Hydrogenedentes bacterium]|jgi:raffinose/stachyose/melibiose transport system permease protein|nr:sugar ABC transporter permease [Candidatus Hydrogenedentota bacterium]